MSGSGETIVFKMNASNGSDLIQALKELNIEIGHISENAISALFDTDSVNDKYLLNWMCSLNRHNTLLSTEKLENEEILKLNLITTAENYQSEFNDLLLQYPKLMNVDDNLLDILLLENEIETLLEEELKQESLILKTR